MEGLWQVACGSGRVCLTAVTLAVQLAHASCRAVLSAGLALLPSFESYTAMNHIALNVQPPKTEWLNMGDWENADNLPEASKHLAQRLYRAADLQPGAAILDVGCGCGDSMLLLAAEYRPSILHGVTSLRSHAARARTRLASKHDAHAVYCEDAVHFVETRARSAPSMYDTIFALDCAYHFTTRSRFFAGCVSLLKPGGTLALVDLIAAHPYPAGVPWFTPSSTIQRPTLSSPPLLARAKHAILTTFTGAHLVSAADYHTDMKRAGLVDMRVIDISGTVFPGFARWLTQLGTESSWRGGGALQLAALQAFGRGPVDTWACGGEEGTVRMVLVLAKTVV